jgi:hypothetical protein
MKNAIVKGTLAAALALCLAGTAAAQSPSANIMGEAKPGDVAIIQNVDTGFAREVKVKDNGRYQLRGLPTGTFRVTIRHADGSSDEPKIVALRIGSTSRVQ